MFNDEPSLSFSTRTKLDGVLGLMRCELDREHAKLVGHYRISTVGCLWGPILSEFIGSAAVIWGRGFMCGFMVNVRCRLYNCLGMIFIRFAGYNVADSKM